MNVSAIDTAVRSAVEQRERRPTPEDRQAIEQLVVAYGMCADFGLVDELVELFEPDAVWDGSNFRFPRCTGHAELKAWFTEVAGRDVRQVHVMDPPLLWHGDDPSTVHGLVPFNAMEADAGSGVFAAQHAYGIYEDEYAQRDGTWRLARRVLHLRLVRR